MTPSSPTLAMQVLTSFLLLAGAGGSGLLAAVRLSRIRGLPTSTAIGSGLLLGLAGVGLLTLVAGHLGALGPWLPWIIAAGGAAAAVRSGGRAVGLIRAATATARREAAQRPLLALTFGLAGSSAVAASLAAPTRVDEVEYHWPAPLEWAAAGQWIDSSYRHVDAFPLMEVLYTVRKSGYAIVRSYLMYKPHLLLGMIGAVMVTAAAVPIVRFLVFFAKGEGNGHIQSLILGSALLVGGLLSLALLVIADLLRTNRILLEDTLERIKRLQYDR